MARDPSAEGTGRKGTSLYDKTFSSLLNLTQLRTLKYQNFDLAPPSGKKISLNQFFGYFVTYEEINEKITNFTDKIIIVSRFLYFFLHFSTNCII